MSAEEARVPYSPRVLIVDGDHRVRQSLSDLLRIAGIELVGSAGDVRSALSMIVEKQPDVVLVDPRLPDVAAGAALLKGIRLGWPGVRVVAMGWSDPAEQPGLLSGISGYIAKAASPESFLAAVLTACDPEDSAVAPVPG